MYFKVLKRENLYAFIKINEDLFTNVNSDIFSCVVYRAPSRSKYSDDNFFDQLSSVLLDYCDETNDTIFLGDFNGRIADLPNNMDLNDKNLDFQSNVLNDFRYRYNRDKEHNYAGKQVLDMLKSFNLRILNRKS